MLPQTCTHILFFLLAYKLAEKIEYNRYSDTDLSKEICLKSILT